ncbi:facilitated trehalose transporter Tret1-2 homolog [Periplaneta americana]|uniref:facilitated trehalose transporter Tret1-2 homolog n=1 Tax=Periplaneta americana TaxID=6978 RepID=UPI0037E75A76
MEMPNITEEIADKNESFGTNMRKTEGKKLPQYIATITVNISSFLHGAGLGWAAPMLPFLQSEASPVGQISDESSSWLGCLLCLGAMFATPLYVYISHRCSRKLTGYLVAVPFIISWILVITATSVTALYFARFLTGMGTGSATVFIPLYVTEIAEDSVRGTLGSFYVLVSYFGVIFVYTVGSYTAYQVTSYLLLVGSGIYLVGFFFMPETPLYHVNKTNFVEAMKSLRWLRRRESSVTEQELNKLIASLGSKEESVKSSPIKEILTSRGPRRALIISIVLVTNLQFSGVVPLLSYTVLIFNEAGSTLSPNVSTIIVGALQIIGSLLATVLVDRAGRKVLLIVSNVCMALCLGAIGGYFFCRSRDIDVSSVSLLPVVCLSAYFVALALGVSPVAFLMIPELFSPQLRTAAITLSLSLMWFNAFLVTKFFTNISDLFGLHGCYWLFTAVCLGGLLFCIFFVPETKNRSLESIQQELNSGRHSNRTSYIKSET